MKTSELIHLLVPLSILCLPFLKVDKLKYMYFLPILLPFLWLVLGKCPMTSRTEEKKGGFVFLQVKKLFPTVSQTTVQNLITFLLVFIVAVSAYKIMKHYGIYDAQ